MSQTPDIQMLLSFFTGFREEKRGEIIDSFIQSLEQHVSHCRAAKTEQDTHKLRTSTHDIKSLCRTIGATGTGERAALIEQKILDNQVNGIFDDIDDFVIEVESVVTAVKKLKTA